MQIHVKNSFSIIPDIRAEKPQHFKSSYKMDEHMYNLGENADTPDFNGINMRAEHQRE